MLRILSLGAGVQSSTLALMAAHGEVEPMPDAAIFADTQWEPAAVYDWLAWLTEQLPFPVHQVTAGNLRDVEKVAKMRAPIRGATRWASLPLFTLSAAGERGMIRRQCTKAYKIEPIEKHIRCMLGLKPRQRWPRERTVEQWYGISLDEIQRCKMELDPDAKWRINRYPLIEQRMTRGHCLEWMQRHGYPQPPRSACIGCPFHHDNEWRDMRDHRPAEWRDAVDFDKSIRKAGGMRGDTYLHAQRVPLDEVDLNSPHEGQLSLLDECEGMCGV